jgi:hypothetical protein
MSVLGQILVLVLTFPAVGLMIYALTVIEERISGGPGRGEPARGEPRERTRDADRGGDPAGTLVRWPADRPGQGDVPAAGGGEHVQAG